MKIVFMGTPGFAVSALTKLIESGHDIVGVYTKEPKPAGRGYAEIKSQIQQLAEANGLRVFTPKNFKTQEAIDELKGLEPDLAVVAAYGLILPAAVLNIPKYGCINIHPSLLPRWRGAAPLQRTIFEGDTQTAVCVMQMDEGMDTGDILLQKNLALDDKITASELHDLAAEIGAEMVLEAVDKIATITKVKQSAEGVTHAKKLTAMDEVIDWKKSAREINCQIRALSPRPGAHFKFNNEKIKIITADYTNEAHSHSSGEVLDDKLSIACGIGVLKPTLLQREGKKMIYTDAFLRGFAIPKGASVFS
ncbi:MAG: methionyl-tRNA formyltransferase [Rickettsiales bacterium]